MDQKKPAKGGKEKAKHSADMDAKKISIVGRTKVKEAKLEAKKSAQNDKDIYSVVGHMERTLFIVDLSKLEAEGDTLLDAIVMYRPLHEISKSQYEQRCSQIIGLSLCMKNLTGEYPKFIHMRGTGFAIRGLGATYVMGLSSRVDEPGSCAVEHLESIYNYFRFYYHSPDVVFKASKSDWGNFISAMSSIFNCIVDRLTEDQHSVPAMLRPLPYNTSLKKGQQAYMLCIRVLRACQKHPSILGGCIMYNSKLVISQFPPNVTEMLTLTGAGGIELDKRSILEDNIAPDKVWVLDVYLTRDEANVSEDQRKDLSAHQATYASLDVNPQLSTSTLHWRFQSSTTTSTSGGTKGIKNRSNWRRQTKSIRSSVMKQHKQKDGRSATSSGSASSLEPPVASSTPQQKQRAGSIKSEDAIEVSPGMSSVSFDHDHLKTKYKNSSQQPEVVGSPLNETDELYLDAVDVDPTAAIGPEMLRLFSRSQSQPKEGKEKETGEEEEGSKSKVKKAVPVAVSTGGAHRGGGSTSSEGFATPSPTPPRTTTAAAVPQLLQGEDTAGLEVVSSFKTACESSLYTTDEEGGERRKEMAGPATAAAGVAAAIRPASHTVGHSSPSKRSRPRISRDSDEDFVDSEDIEAILKRVAEEGMAAHSSPHPSIAKSNSFRHIDENPPPPLPSRSISVDTASTHASIPIATPITTNQVESIPTLPAKHPTIKEEEEMPPLLPPRKSLPKEDAKMTTVPTKEEDIPPPLPHRKLPPEKEETPPPIPHRKLPLEKEPPPPLPHRKLPPEEEEEIPPPLPDRTMMTGVLAQPIGYPYLPQKQSTKPSSVRTGGATGNSTTTGNNAATGNGGDNQEASGSESADTRPSSWIYDTLSRTQQPSALLTGSKSSKDSAKKRLEEQEKTAAPVAPSNPSPSRPPRNIDYEEIDDDVVQETLGKKPSLPSSSPHRHKTTKSSNDYEEIDDDLIDSNTEARKGTRSCTSVSESSDGGGGGDRGGHAYMDTEDNASSKNSSMTVTLDLSHITKDDMLYSRDKRMSSSVDIVNNNNDESSEETVGDGTVTPVETTYSESMFNAVRMHKRTSENVRAPQKDVVRDEANNKEEDGNESAEYSSLPDEDDSVYMSEVGEQDMMEGAQNRKNWLPQTLDRHKMESPKDQERLEHYCVYVQQHMNTFIILLADSGLQEEHTVLDEQWRFLAEQLLSLEMMLEEKTVENSLGQSTVTKGSSCTVCYSGYERMCEAKPLSAAYHFRHAVRRAHQEYLSDNTLRQVSLSKEHCRVLSQRVHEREVYVQPAKVSGDALSLHSALERHAKFKISLRQQPIGGPKVMFI